MKRISRQEKKTAAYYIALLACIWFGFTYVQHTTFSYVIGDTTVAQNALYNTLQGEWFYQAALSAPNNFREHISLVQILFLPFFKLISHTLTLYAVVHLFYAVTGYILYLFVRKRSTAVVATVATVLFLLHPLTTAQAVGAFHVGALAGPFLLLTLLAYESRRYELFLLGCLALFLIPEFIAPTIVAIGAIAFLERRSWKWSVPPVLAGVSLYLAATQYVTLGNGSHDSIARAFRLSSWDQIPFVRERIIYGLQAILPIGFLPLLFSAYSIILIPTLLIIGWIVQFERFPGSAHLFSVVPAILTIVFVHVMTRGRKSAWSKKFMLAICITGLLLSIPLHKQWLSVDRDKPSDQYKRAISYIIDDGSVSTPAHTGPHLANRRDLYMHLNFKEADYVIISEYDLLRSQSDNPLFVRLVDYFDKIQQSDDYRNVFTQGSVSLYIKKEKLQELLDLETLDNQSDKQLRDGLSRVRDEK